MNILKCQLYDIRDSVVYITLQIAASSKDLYLYCDDNASVTDSKLVHGLTQVRNWMAVGSARRPRILVSKGI